MRWLDGNPDSMDVSVSKFHEIVKDREAWHVAVHGVAKRWTRLSDWTATNQTMQFWEGDELTEKWNKTQIP